LSNPPTRRSSAFTGSGTTQRNGDHRKLQHSSVKSIFKTLTGLGVDRRSELSASILLYVDREWNKPLDPTGGSGGTFTENVARDDIRSPMKLWQDHPLNVRDTVRHSECASLHRTMCFGRNIGVRRSRKSFSIDTAAIFESLTISSDATCPETRLSRHSDVNMSRAHPRIILCPVSEISYINQRELNIDDSRTGTYLGRCVNKNVSKTASNVIMNEGTTDPDSLLVVSVVGATHGFQMN
jgi:hypothetical protein